MPRTSTHPKIESFNFRVAPELKAAFTAAAAEDDKPAGRLFRDFMRRHVERKQVQKTASQHRRNARILAKRAADPASDEAEVMRWTEGVSDREGWTA